MKQCPAGFCVHIGNCKERQQIGYLAKLLRIDADFSLQPLQVLEQGDRTQAKICHCSVASPLQLHNLPGFFRFSFPAHLRI